MASGTRWDLQSGEADSGTSTLPWLTLPPGVDTTVLSLGLCRCIRSTNQFAVLVDEQRSRLFQFVIYILQ